MKYYIHEMAKKFMFII